MNGDEILILIVLALVVVGPQRLPQYAEQLAHLVRNAKKMATGATQTIREELGEDMVDLDLAKFDPRQYDPRRIVRDALMEDVLPATKPARKRTSSTRSSTAGVAAAAGAVGTATAARSAQDRDDDEVADGDALAGVGAGGAAPFDDEAT